MARRWLPFLLLFLLLLSACTPAPATAPAATQARATASATSTPAPTSTPAATATPTPTASPTATDSPTPSPTPAPTASPTATASPEPTATPTPEPTATPTPTTPAALQKENIPKALWKFIIRANGTPPDLFIEANSPEVSDLLGVPDFTTIFATSSTTKLKNGKIVKVELAFNEDFKGYISTVDYMPTTPDDPNAFEIDSKGFYKMETLWAHWIAYASKTPGSENISFKDYVELLKQGGRYVSSSLRQIVVEFSVEKGAMRTDSPRS